MVARKQFLGVREADPRLQSLLAEARERPVTEAELLEQRVSFAFGNAPDSQLITKDSVRASSTRIRLAAE
jgi:hypothetical protein